MRIFFISITILLAFTFNAEARYVSVSWDAVAGATSYELYWGAESGMNPWTYSSTSTYNGFTITGTEYQIAIDEGETYVVVTAVDGTGESLESTEIVIPASIALTQDGYATPEQISIYLSMDSTDYSATMTATMRYRKNGTDDWTTGHDLYHLRSGAPMEGFAWVITGLDMDSTYSVEVTTHDGATDVTYGPMDMRTRGLPASAGAATITIPAGSSTSEIEALFATAEAGDVIQFENGTYTVDSLDFYESGAVDNYIYIRGESRDGVIISDTTNTVLKLTAAEHVVIENLTISGSNVNSGISASSVGIDYYSGIYNNGLKGDVTIRNITMVGTDKGIVVSSLSEGLLVYENILTGNNGWTLDQYEYSSAGPPMGGNGIPDIDEATTWNDDGMFLGGSGNAIFNNTVTGFGDALSAEGGGNLYNHSVHFYRNKLISNGDDAIEVDNGKRNITVYDNHIQNSSTMVSVDDSWIGPYIIFRNTAINSARQMIKDGDNTWGFFIYNNTIVNPPTTKVTPNWTLRMPKNGIFYDYAVVNNIFIMNEGDDFRGAIAWQAPIGGMVDWTNNSYSPDGAAWWEDGNYENHILNAYEGLPSYTPQFGVSTRVLQDFAISELQPFETAIVLGENQHTEITTMYTPILSTGGVSKNTGIEIIGVTDDYSGVAPDRGAIISGRSIPVYGAGATPPPIPESKTLWGSDGKIWQFQ